MKKIAFDIDGVVLDFTSVFLSRARELGLLLDTGYSDIVKYQINECTNLTRKEVTSIVHYVLSDQCEYRMEIMPGAEETLTELSEHSVLTFVTARPGIHRKTTKKAIYSVLPNVDKKNIKIVHICGINKHKILNELEINTFVEDRTRNARILNEKGINTLLYDRPWNQSKESFHRVKTWDEIREFIFN